MCTQKTRPVDAFQHITASFKQFESKLDKLQQDVDFHGKTLSELRTMVSNLSGGAILAAVGNTEESRITPNKSTPIQYEVRIKNNNNPISSAPPKLKVKSYQSQKSKAKMSPQISPFQVHGNKMELGPKGTGQKHALRHRRADAQRKAMNTLRSQKLTEKKRVR